MTRLDVRLVEGGEGRSDDQVLADVQILLGLARIARVLAMGFVLGLAGIGVVHLAQFGAEILP